MPHDLQLGWSRPTISIIPKLIVRPRSGELTSTLCWQSAGRRLRVDGPRMAGLVLALQRRSTPPPDVYRWRVFQQVSDGM